MKTKKFFQTLLVSLIQGVIVIVFVQSCDLGIRKTSNETLTFTIADAPVVNGWHPFGPGGGGALFQPMISPHNKDVMMALCDMTGTFLTKNGGETWTTLYFNGTTDTYCFDPTDPDIIYVGATKSGLWKTIDGGETWQNIQQNFDPGTRVTRIAVDPANNRIVYIGTANSSFHVSTDGGMTFEKNIFPDKFMRPTESHSGYQRSGPGNGSLKDITSMLYVDPESPANARVIYSFNRNNIEKGFIVHKSSINRIEKTGPGPSDYEITYIDPPIPTNIFSIDWVYDPNAPAGKKTTYYISMASESLSTPADSEPRFPNQFKNPEVDMYDGSIWKTNDLNDPASYTLVADNNTKALRDIFLQYNNYPKDPLTMTKFKAASNQVFYMQVVTYGRENVSGNYHFGYLRSTNGGLTWEWLVFKEEGEMTYPDVDRCPPSWLENHFGYEYAGAAWGIATSKLAPDATDASAVRVFITEQGILQISDDGGYSWRSGHTQTTTKDDGYVYGVTNGIQVTSTYDISFDPFDADHIILSKTDIGQFVTYDGGKSWRPNEDGLMPEPYGWKEFKKFEKENPGYLRYWTNTCYKTVFDPDVKDKLWSVWSGQHDMPRRAVRSSANAIPGCVAVSDDGGRRWNIQAGYQKPVAQTGMPERTTIFTDIVIDPKSDPDNRTLYVATMGHGVYKSVDGGATWKQKVRGIKPLKAIPEDQMKDGMFYRAYKLMMTPDGTLYVTMYPSTSTLSDGGIYRSLDGAETWGELTSPGGTRFVWRMDYDWSDPTSKTLYAAAENSSNKSGGIYKSTDGGYKWNLLLGNTTPDFTGRAVKVDITKATTVYASSNNGHLMQSDDAGKTWRDLPLKLQWHEGIMQNPHKPDLLYVVTFGLGAWYGPVKTK